MRLGFIFGIEGASDGDGSPRGCFGSSRDSNHGATGRARVLLGLALVHLLVRSNHLSLWAKVAVAGGLGMLALLVLIT